MSLGRKVFYTTAALLTSLSKAALAQNSTHVDSNYNSGNAILGAWLLFGTIFGVGIAAFGYTACKRHKELKLRTTEADAKFEAAKAELELTLDAARLQMDHSIPEPQQQHDVSRSSEQIVTLPNAVDDFETSASPSIRR